MRRATAEGENFKPSGGTKGGESVESDPVLVAALQKLALAAFTAVGGTRTSYGRVDIRERSPGGEPTVLEVNPMCSLTPGSYFDLSLKGNSSTMPQWLQSLIELDD